MKTLARPEGHNTITPSAVVPQVGRVVAFLRETFGAVETDRYEHEGHVMHVEMKIGDSVVMMGEPTPGFETMPAMLTVYVDGGAEAVDATYRRALAAGATSLQEPKDVTPVEAKKRFAAMIGG
jgi:PhnB protein